MKVNMHEAKTRLSQLVEQALRGEEVIIARNGAPAVRLTPIEAPAQKRVLGFGKGNLTVEQALEPMTEEELQEWE